MSMSDPHSTAHGNQVGEVDLSFGAVIAGRRSAHGAPPPLAHILTPAPRHQGRCYFPVYSAERQRITSGATQSSARRLVHAVLGGTSQRFETFVSKL
jgi:hypothetical protein